MFSVRFVLRIRRRDLFRLFAILNLAFLLFELTDPTTPFIRVSGAPRASQKLTMQKALTRLSGERAAQAVQSPSWLTKSDADSQTSAMSFQLAQSEAHYSVGATTLHFDSIALPSLPTVFDTGLSDQYDPPTLKRPPIARA